MSTLVNIFLRRLWTGQFRPKPCSHQHLMRKVEPQSMVCEQCVALGDSWPALRVCLVCGFVGCCEQAKNQHAYRHYQETGHPLVRPLNEPFMNWIWCYEDKALLDPR
jgi:uncharacterized UBP type Zn finger protein